MTDGTTTTPTPTPEPTPTPSPEPTPTPTPEPTPPEWLASLPDELQQDATLSRYADVPALAKAHIEAHKVAKSKVIVPGADATEEQMGQFFDAIGRPESPDKYDITMPELSVDATDEQRAALAAEYQPFRELAHRIGLRPEQAKALSDFEIGRQQALYAQGEAEIQALKEKLGADYEPKKDKAVAIYAKLFGDEADALLLADELDSKVGSARLLTGMMRLAEMAGEHGIVAGDTVEGLGVVKDAEAKLKTLQADAGWRDRFEKGDAPTVAQHGRLLKLAQEQALRPTRRV